jgi:hypothetical protein
MGGDGGLGGAGVAGTDHAGDTDQLARQLDQLSFVDARENGGRPDGGHDGRAYC